MLRKPAWIYKIRRRPVIYAVTVQAKVQNIMMVDVLILMVHPDLAGVVSMASMRAEMIGWLIREG